MERFSRQEAASLGTYLGVLRRRAWIIAVCVIVAPVVAYELSSRQTTLYRTSADVYVNQQNIAAALTGISSYNPGNAALAIDTQASLAAVPSVAGRALKLSKLHDRSAYTVLGQTSITPNERTNILTFTVVDSSSTNAALIANSYAKAFTVFSNHLGTQPLTKGLAEVQAAIATLKAEKRKGSALYRSLVDRKQQLELLQNFQSAGTVVIRPAAPGGRISPHPKKDAALGLILGIVLGFGLAFGLEALDTRVRSAAELSDGLGGLPLLARIPPPTSAMQKRDELAMVVQPKHTAAEAFRLLRTNLDFMRLSAGEMRTILVTSAVEKEGKSTTAANLAVAEARAGRRVALVDLDLRRPYLDRFFRLSAVEGVTDVALGRVELSQALQRIDLSLGAPEPGSVPPSLLSTFRSPVAQAGVLDVLASGPLPPDPGEFAASFHLAQILSALRESYDTVIVDTPPILWVGDALTLSSQADGLIVISRLKGVRKPMLRELGRILDVVPSRKLGLVITGPVTGESGVYGSGDGYAYGYGYSYRSGNGNSRSVPEDEPSRGTKLGSFNGQQGTTRVAAEGKPSGEGRAGPRTGDIEFLDN